VKNWLVLFALALALTMGLSKASGEQINSGLNVVGYSITDVPPIRSDTEYKKCGVGWYEQINYTWDYEQNLFGDCGWDSFMLHYTGSITIPDGVDSVRFGIASDDGSDVTIAGHQFGSWTDKGCSMDYSDRYQLDTSTPLKLDAWFYENGGNTCFMLFWQFNGDDQDWSIVPASAFSREIVKTTTTSSSTTTTTQEPTTTSSTTLAPTTTTLPLTTTTVRPTTTSTSTTSTSTTTTTQEPATTTTFTTSTTVPETTSTIALQAPQTSVEPSTTTSTVFPTTTTETPTTTVPPIVSNQKVSQDKAVELATNPEVLKTATVAEAVVIFTSLNENTITDAQGEQIVAAVQEAPLAIRAVFEQKIDVFAGHTDTYKPIGSVVTVGQRRVIIVTTLALCVTPPVVVRKKDE
jgi:hypothetical protein